MSITTNEMYMLEYMPEIMVYKNRFDTLNGLLNKTTLTGKISSLKIAENLFMFMDDTQQKFSILQDKLINTLVFENYRKVYSDNLSNAQAIIDIIVRSLYSRSKDIQYIAKDKKLSMFLSGEKSEDSLRHDFSTFFARFTVYADMFIFDNSGLLIYDHKKEYDRKVYEDPFLHNTLKTDNGYLHTITNSFLGYSDSKAFIFSAPIKNSDGIKVGILAFQYDFLDEMTRIFKKFTNKEQNSVTLFIDEQSRVVASSNEIDFPKNSKINTKKYGEFLIATNNKKDFIFAEAVSRGYNGYNIPNWKILILTPLRSAYHSQHPQKVMFDEKAEDKEDGYISETSLMTKELQEVVLEAENINEDLGDVVINGEIIASKSRSYSLNPILNNIRNISEEINSVCLKSINGLLKTIMDSTADNVKFNAEAAASIFDRMMYETSNGCRWLSGNATIKDITKDEHIQPQDKRVLSEILSEYNDLYHYCYNILLLDRNGYIIAVSNKEEEKIVGEQVENVYTVKAKNNSDENRYFISEFEQTKYSNNKPTYTLYSSVVSDKQHKTNLGVICYILKPEIIEEAINCSLPSIDDRGIYGHMYGIIATKNGLIIASTNSDYKVGSTIEIDEEFLKLQKGEGNSITTEIGGKKYIIGGYILEGYREFRKSDGYNTEHISMMFIQV